MRSPSAALRKTLCTALVVVALLSSSCEQLVAPIGSGPLRYRDRVFDDIATTEGIVYGSARDQSGALVELTIDISQPVGDTAAARPAIVFFHGGGFRAGSPQSPEILDQTRYFVRRGYVVASASYRTSANGCSQPGPECLTAVADAFNDAQRAVAHLRTNAAALRIDPTRIAAAGSSAGAINALNLAFSSSGEPETAVRAAVSLSGSSLLTAPNEGDAPVLLFHNTQDWLIPYASAEATVAAATAAGVRAVLTTWDSRGHVPFEEHRVEILRQTRNFLYWHMDLASLGRVQSVG